MNNNIRLREHKKAFKNLKDFKSNDLKINIDDYMYMYTRTYNDGHEYDIFKNIHTRHNEAVKILEVE